MWKLCPEEFIRTDAVLKIILERGIKDGTCIQTSLESVLNSTDAPIELAKAASVMNITDIALDLSSNAIEVANLAIDLAMTPNNLTMVDAITKITFEIAESSITTVRQARFTSQNSRQSLGGHGLHG